MSGRMPFRWDDELRRADRPAASRRVRAGASSRRWFDVDPCYVFHIVNAWDTGSGDGDVVFLDAGRHASMWRGSADTSSRAYSTDGVRSRAPAR